MSKIPPDLKNIVHITNTESAQKRLKEKTSIRSKMIPNTLELDKLQKADEYNRDFREALGIKDDQLIFLQPTRVKRNKYVERSIKLVAEINDLTKKDNVLIITGSPVYSRGNYFEETIRKKDKLGVNVIFANDRIFLGRHQNPEKKFYSIDDAYVHADVIIYPNTGDAFGNPVIEAAAYSKPLIVNTFPNLQGFLDKGFRFIVMDNKVDNELVSDAYALINDQKKLKETVEHNYSIIEKRYSSDALDDTLIPILNDFDKRITNQKTLVSRVKGMIPSRIWRPGPSQKKKSFKGKGPKRSHKDKGPDLKNKKGGYKEPVKK